MTKRKTSTDLVMNVSGAAATTMASGNVEVGDSRGGGNGSASKTRGEVVKHPRKRMQRAGEDARRRFEKG